MHFPHIPLPQHSASDFAAEEDVGGGVEGVAAGVAEVVDGATEEEVDVSI